MYDDDDLTIPDFLDRKKNPCPPSTPEEIRAAKAAARRGPAIVWPKKKNWRKIEARRRAKEKAEGGALAAGTFKISRGQ